MTVKREVLVLDQCDRCGVHFANPRENSFRFAKGRVLCGPCVLWTEPGTITAASEPVTAAW